MYKIVSNETTLVSDSPNITNEEKVVIPKIFVPELLPKGKFGSNAPRNVLIRPA